MGCPGIVVQLLAEPNVKPTFQQTRAVALDRPPRSASELLSGQETSTAVYIFSTILNCYGSRAVIAVSRSIRWYSWKLSRVSGM